MYFLLLLLLLPLLYVNDGIMTGQLTCISFLCGIAGRVFNGSGKAVDKGPQVLAEDYLDIQGITHYY